MTTDTSVPRWRRSNGSCPISWTIPDARSSFSPSGYGCSTLVRDFAVDRGIEFALHTGSVPQMRRRAEIRRFREDPECRLFLSSESGGVGLNLQVADTVINMDQPWNPARLEQRVARAWRKHQTRAVSVINLVSENTIEHRMLGLLDQKRVLAEGVIDRRGELSAMRMPTSRAAFLERLHSVLDTASGGRGCPGRRRFPGRDARSAYAAIW